MAARTGLAGTPKERLERRLVRQPNDCLVWTGGLITGGYGQIRVGKRTTLVHRLAWQLANGPIPEGIHVLHHCDNPPCCETEPSEEYPEGHLFLGTDAENTADKVAKGRCFNQKKTHCKRGHELSGENLLVRPRGWRSCITCRRAAERMRYWARIKSD